MFCHLLLKTAGHRLLDLGQGKLHPLPARMTMCVTDGLLFDRNFCHKKDFPLYKLRDELNFQFTLQVNNFGM
jgi:hypothetical protein